MKDILKFGSILFILILASCEDVVKVDLDKNEPRLVIEASITWIKGTQGNVQQISITRTSEFYEEEVEGVEDATVTVTSENGNEFDFLHDENGIYMNTDFQPIVNQQYDLEVIYNDEIYTASEIMIPVSKIDFVEQTEFGGFSGEDVEVKAYYTDPAETEDYYLFKFRDEDVSLEFYEDEFTNGNQIFGYYSTEDLEQGDKIEIQIQGISKDYYEYLFILRSQIGTNQGGPFETMPATVKGNIINRTAPDNYPFGYFRLSEVDTTSYIIQ